MAWNGSSGNDGQEHPARMVSNKKTPSPIRGVVAGLVVVALAVGAYFAVFSGDRPKVERPPAPNGVPSKIAEVKPVPTPTDAVDGESVCLTEKGTPVPDKLRLACQEGWARQPTNSFQTDVWNEMRQISAKPIIVKYAKEKEG